MLEQEDIRWKQRAKQNWHQNGDRNTHFLHAWASHRRRINTIKKIKDGDGRDWTKPEDISKVFINFYKNLFTTDNTVGIEECLEGMELR